LIYKTEWEVVNKITMGANNIRFDNYSKVDFLTKENFILINNIKTSLPDKISIRRLLDFLNQNITLPSSSEWETLEIPVSESQITNCGTSPVILLPALTGNQYYEYEWIIEADPGTRLGYSLTNNPLPNDNYFIGDKVTMIGNLFPFLSYDGKSGVEGKSVVMGSSKNATLVSDTYSYSTQSAMVYPQLVGNPIVFSTFLDNNPYHTWDQEYPILIKIKYKLNDFTL
jgi:hypothetical protein